MDTAANVLRGCSCLGRLIVAIVLVGAVVMLVRTTKNDATGYLAPITTTLESKLVNSGTELLKKGDLPGARSRYDTALKLSRFFKNTEWEVQTLVLQGKLEEQSGQPDQAINLMERAVAKAQDARAARATAVSSYELAQLYNRRGQTFAASATYLRCAVAAQAAGERELQAQALLYVGKYAISHGYLDQSLSTYKVAIALWEAEGNKEAEAISVNGLGMVYSSAGLYDQALDLFQKALDIAREAKRADLQAVVLQNMGNAYYWQVKNDEALAAWAQSLKLAREAKAPWVELRALTSSATAAKTRGDWDTARELAGQALAIEETTDDQETKAAALSVLAEVASHNGRHQEALQRANEGYALAQKLGSPETLALSLHTLGKVYEQQGKYDDARQFYLQALSELDTLRWKISLDDFKANLLDQYSELYVDAVTLLLDQGRKDEAFAVSERVRARAFLDQAAAGGSNQTNATDDFKLAETARTISNRITSLEKDVLEARSVPAATQDAQKISSLEKQLDEAQREYTEQLMRLKNSDPASRSSVSPLTLTLPQVQQLLDADTTLLSYFQVTNGTLAFIVTRDSFHTVTIPLKGKDMQRAADDFLSFATLDAAPPASARQLYDWLVAPVRPYLTTRLVGIIPHSIVNYVPLGALYDGSHYLAEDYDLFYLPSASSLPLIQSRRRPAGEATFLTLSYARPEGLPALRYADAEAEGVAQLFGGAALTGASATRSALQARAANARILHLAAHAEINVKNPLFSRIFLAPDGQDDGRLEVPEIYNLDLGRTDLVVLSACQTQLGARSWSDDVAGLSRAFIYAGSPSVLASLWNVDDQATSDLMLAFYRNLKGGAGKAAALRAAQNEIRAKYPNPYYWAAFTLIGDPGAPAAAQ